MKKLLPLFLFVFGVQLLSAQMTVAVSSTNVTCNSTCDGTASANPTLGTPPYTYLWSPSGAITQSVTGLCAGNYTVTVTDALSGVAVGTTTILNSPNAVITPANATVCLNAPTTFSANPSGGTAPYSFSWASSGGVPATSTLQNPQFYWTTPGTRTFTVTITDALGCTSSATTTVTVSPAPNITVTPSNSFICIGGTMTLAGGGGITYLWNPGGNTTQSITVSPASTTSYTLSAIDAAGCSGTATATITVDQLAFTGVSYSPSTFCDSQSVALSATGVTGGSPPYSYTATPNNIFGPASVYAGPGTYTVTITDANGCVASNTTTLSPYPNTLSVTLSAVEAGCNSSNGSVSSVVSGGTGPYTYTWSNLTTAPYIINLPSAVYSVLITDNLGCIKQRSIWVGDSCDFVWPGDANDDAVADNLDILDIGIANGAMGSTRASATTNWIGQPSAWWGTTLLSGTDYKFVDCNGDGTIDPADTNAVVQNFGLTHNNRLGGTPVYDAMLPDLTVTMGQNILAANSAGTLSIAFGSSSVPVSNFYGLAFTLNFDATQIDASTFRMNENGTWMGIPGTDLMGVVMNNGNGTGSVQVAITRLNHVNSNGFGNIANVGFMTTGAMVATGNMQNVNFTISDVTVIDANETPQTVNTIGDSLYVADPVITGISANENIQTISAYPNPFDESVQLTLPGNLKGKVCDITLTDASGRIVLTQQNQNSDTITIYRGQLEAGIYFCTVRCEGQLMANQKLIIK